MWDLGNKVGALLVEGRVEGLSLADWTLLAMRLPVCIFSHGDSMLSRTNHTMSALQILLESCHNGMIESSGTY
jgi:hypothetical protein